MLELTEDFIKFMQIGLMVVGVITIVLMFISYNVNITYDQAKRDSYYLGDYMLGSKCLTMMNGNDVIKSFFSESKLNTIVPSCISYPNGKVDVDLINCDTHIKCHWNFELITGGTYKGAKSNFTVAVEMNAIGEDGSTEPATMMVTV